MNVPVSLLGGAVLGAHGIGHVLGWLPAWGLANFENLSRRSWALDPVVGERISRAVGGVLFVVPTVGFVAAAAALMTGQPWWREIALVSAVVSLVTTALFPASLPASSVIGATAVNLAVLGLAAWGGPVLAGLVRH